MDSLLLDIPLGIILVSIASLALIMWIGLMAAFGEAIVTDIYRLCRPHSIVTAKIIDQRIIEVEYTFSRRPPVIGIGTVYRLRYEYAGAMYEIEWLVRNESNVEMSRSTGNFLLYVPHAQPAHATAASYSSSAALAAVALMVMSYIVWASAPELLAWSQS